MNKQFWIVLTLLLTVGFLTGCNKKQATEPPVTPGLSMLHTDGRWFVNEDGKKVLLRGVNIPGMEWDSSGDHMLEAVGVAIDVWKCNILRIPLSQDRWFGYAPEQQDAGLFYRKTVEDIIEKAEAKMCYIWLDLHWNNLNHWGKYIGQHRMPDRASLLFWRDIAAIYKNHPAILFGLYNEPHGIDWDVWRDGGELTESTDDGDITYTAVGFQRLANEIREMGADNILIIAGLDWGFDLRGILDGYALEGSNIAYDTHPYPWKDTDWDGRWGNVAEVYPLFVGEWGGGEDDSTYFETLTNYMEEHLHSWAGWCFHPAAGPQMLQDWQYNPTYFGQVVIDELQKDVKIE